VRVGGELVDGQPVPGGSQLGHHAADVGIEPCPPFPDSP
jgi:hypothetical protein